MAFFVVWLRWRAALSHCHLATYLHQLPRTPPLSACHAPRHECTHTQALQGVHLCVCVCEPTSAISKRPNEYSETHSNTKCERHRGRAMKGW